MRVVTTGLVCLSVFTAQACSPDFAPDVFVLPLRPDHPREFAQGKLGVLLPTYPRTDLAVAFRYLNGGILNPSEQTGYEPTYANDDPAGEKQWNTTDSEAPGKNDPVRRWQAIHAKYAAATGNIEQDRQLKQQQPNGAIYRTTYQNCNGDAFVRASATLQSRVKIWGERSTDLADWIEGQDAVFSNCSSEVPKLPVAAPAGTSMLLRQDRAYQIAAAKFYGAPPEEAQRSFEAIAMDKDSPWRGVARYLAARCLVRQAFYSRTEDSQSVMATFDSELMRKAEVALAAMLKTSEPGISHNAIQKELDLVRLRLEPIDRLRELAHSLAGPATDGAYGQHLKDLTWYLDIQLDSKAVREDTSDDAIGGAEFWQHPTSFTPEKRAAAFSETYRQLASLRSTSTLVDWLITFQSPAREAKEHAFLEWKKSGQLYWLTASIAKATEEDPEAPALVTAAENVDSASPASELLNYHRARLLIGLRRAAEARSLLDGVMPHLRSTGRTSSLNLYLGLRMRASESLRQAMTYAPQAVLWRTSEEQASVDECLDVMKNPKRKYDCRKEIDPLQFSKDAAGFFNRETPLRTLVEIANSDMLPEQLRGAVATMAWTRSVLLQDDAAAAKLLPLLPAKLQKEAGTSGGFRAIMAIVRNPGLRPYLDSGIQRSYSYDFVQSYSDNWWCENWQASNFSPQETPMPKEQVAFLALEQAAEAQRQVSELKRQGGAEVMLGSLVLSYAKDHPADEDVPEALYLVLRLIRYGCGHGFAGDTTNATEEDRKEVAIQRETARLLRQRYPSSPWTKKAAPIAGN